MSCDLSGQLQFEQRNDDNCGREMTLPDQFVNLGGFITEHFEQNFLGLRNNIFFHRFVHRGAGQPALPPRFIEFRLADGSDHIFGILNKRCPIPDQAVTAAGTWIEG